jgi:solute carrier family 25 carnitine/acylcarnitine transporter 20/29
LHYIKVNIFFKNQGRADIFFVGMASPLLGIAGVNSLLFASYGISKRIITPFPQLSLKEIALAGAMAGMVNAVLASPGTRSLILECRRRIADETLIIVEMFKVRMQGQYGAETDKRLSVVVSEMWKNWGFRKGIMRGYWVSCHGGGETKSCST